MHVTKDVFVEAGFAHCQLSWWEVSLPDDAGRVRIVGAVRWIIDAMNVIGSRPDGWWSDRRGAMTGLVDRLERWAVAEGQQVTVVFERPLRPPIRSAVLEIAQAPRAGANSADDEIVRVVRADGQPHEITVVTSDLALIDRVRSAGAQTHPAARFRTVIDTHR